MNNYLIARVQNLKITDIGAVGKEQEREQHYIEKYYKNPDHDPDKTERNITLEHDKERDGKTWERYVKDFKEDHNIQGRFNLNSGKNGTNIATSFMVTTSKEYMDSLSEREQVQFYKHAYEAIKEMYPSYHFVEATIHRDETTPHLHVIALPLYEDKEKDRIVFNTTKTQPGKYHYRDFQDHMHSFMQERGHDVNRGIRGSDREHLTVQQYKEQQELEKEKAILLEKPTPERQLLGIYKYNKDSVDRLAEERAILYTQLEQEKQKNEDLTRELHSLYLQKDRAERDLKAEHDYRLELQDKLEDREYLIEHIQELEREQEKEHIYDRSRF